MTSLISPTSPPLDNNYFTKLDLKEDNNGSCAVLEEESPEVVRSPVSPLFETFTECAKQVVTEVEGHIPEWISGTVVRVGPGKFEFGEDKMKHWFDGHAIVHKFTLKQGKVTFQSRFVESETYKANTLHQRITATEFGTASTPDPCMSMFARFKANFFKTNRTDNANVNVFKYGDALIVNTDSPIAQVVQPDLTTVGKTNMSESIAVNMVTSHPHFDAEGAMYVSASSFKGRPRYQIVRIPPPTKDQRDTLDLLSRAEIVAEIPARHALHPTYCHSFGMTDNYFVFCETPVTLNLIKTLTRVFIDAPINDVFNYDPEAMALFHIINRRTGQRINTQFQIKGIFFYHMINCYEEDDHLIIDLCSFYDFKDSDLFTEPLEEFRNGLFIEEKKWAQYKHHPLRLVVPLTDHSLHETGANLVTLPNTDCKAHLTGQNVITLEGERLLPQGQDRIDMPQINYEKFNGKKYKYFYGTGLFVNQHFMNALGKVDVENKTCLRWLGTVNQYPSEPVFVPSPQATSEDDGVVLSSVCDTDPEKRDFLVVLDASTFQEIGRAYVPSDVTVPYSFHGSYYNH